MARKKFLVKILNKDGNIEHHPMKKWLRDNPGCVPSIDPSRHTAHQIREALKKQGWQVVETVTEVILSPPDQQAVPDLLRFKKLFEARLLSLENDAKRAFLPEGDVAYSPFPILMYSFATVDYFSSFWAGWNDTRKRPNSDQRSQAKRMADFLEKYLLYPQKESQLAVTIWRHKLMHTAEPRVLTDRNGKTRYGWSISDKDEQHWELIEADGTLVLHIGVFNLINDLRVGIMGPMGYFWELKGSATLQKLCQKAIEELSAGTFELQS